MVGTATRNPDMGAEGRLPRQINQILTRLNPDFDTFFAIWIAMTFGGDQYPGIQNAQINYVDHAKVLPGEEDALAIGVGPAPVENRAICYARQFAMLLGVEGDFALRRLLKYAQVWADGKDAQAFTMGNIVNALHHYQGGKPEKVQSLLWPIIAAFYCQDKTYQQQADLFCSRAAILEVPGKHGNLRIALIRSDDPMTLRYARSEGGGDCQATVNRKSNGHTQIWLHKKVWSVDELARVIRLEEQRRKNQLRVTKWEELSRDGVVGPWDNWFCDSTKNQLLNGSESWPSAEPTGFSLEEIAEIVKNVLDPRAFEPSREENCRKGICCSSGKSRCPWFGWGLKRCRTIRYRSKK